MALPEGINIRDFSYDLPSSRVAQRPLETRDASRLLVCSNDTLSDCLFSELDSLLPQGSLLVFNDTRVVRARLVFRKPGGSAVEIFCLEPVSGSVSDIQLAFSQTGTSRWNCLIGNARKWKSGKLEMDLREPGRKLMAERKGEAVDGCFEIEFSWLPASSTFSEILSEAGRVPLPPYISRPADEADEDRYQTVFARHEGSVAAPTAGLHFTPELLERIRANHCREVSLTLHVGLGTFRPVTSSDIRGHVMHNETFSVSVNTLSQLLETPARLVTAIGTTSARTLESLYWLGVKAIAHPEAENNEVLQWDPYEYPENSLPSAAEALHALLKMARRKGLNEVRGKTGLIIVPGYRFRMMGCLITNFHMPASTLLLLVAAFAGDGWKKAYEHALAKGYRFLSYGDACMFFPK